MDPEYVASWFVGVSASITILSYLKGSGRRSSMLVANAAVLAVLAITKGLGVGHAGYVALASWGAFVATPLWAARQVARLSALQRFRGAAMAARVLSLSHPFGGNAEAARYLDARALSFEGRTEQARRRLESLAGSKRFGELARLELIRLDDDWEGIVQRVGAQAVGTRPLTILPVYARALAETGRVAELLDVYAAVPRAVRMDPALWPLILAFCGCTEALDRLLSGLYVEMAPETKRYWTATALQAAGQVERAREILEATVASGGPLAEHARYRLASRVTHFDPSMLSETGKVVLGQIDQATRAAIEFRRRTLAARPLATWTLMGALGLVFLVTVPGGSTNQDNLVALGALVLPTERADDFYFRVLAAGFLHYGPVHLAMNLFGLWLLGSELERHWGAARTVAVFFGASVGAYLAAPVLMTATLTEPRYLVGASAGVMGLVGGLGAFSTLGYLRDKAARFRRQLQAIGILLGVQILFDWSTPMVASTLHASGFVLGVIVALPLAVTFWRSRRPAAAT